MQLEINAVFKENPEIAKLKKVGIFLTPPVGQDYWVARIKVSREQWIVAFPKFGTIGIGFAREEKDWNTNLPYTCPSEVIYDHIRANRGQAKRATCLKAISLLKVFLEDSPNVRFKRCTG